ncbi:unnamed protein product, partial [marine sediment metagenome]
MPNSASKSLVLVKNLINEVKLDEALNYIKEIEQLEHLSNEAILKTHAYKARIQFDLGEFQNALKIAEKLHHKSQELKMPLFSLDALYIKVWVLHFQGKMEDKNKLIEQYEKIFRSIPREDSFEFQERENCLWMIKGNRNFLRGNFDLSLDYFARSL